MTVAAAHAIENELRIREAFAENELAFSYQKTVIASIPEALITIDNKGRISLINDNARKMFHLETEDVSKANRSIRLSVRKSPFPQYH